MSSYNSSSQDQDENNQQTKFFTMFQNDFFLTNSVHIVEQWKVNISNSLDQNKKIIPMKYLQIQFPHLKKQQNLLLASYHIRSFAFCHFINQAFTFLKVNYDKQHQNSNLEQKQKAIQKLDNQIIRLSQYLQYAEQSRIGGYAQEIQQNIIQKNYALIRHIFPLMLNYYAIWRLVMLIQSFRSEQHQYLLNVTFNMKQDYYQKCLKQFESKSAIVRQIHEKISKIIESKLYKAAYFEAVQQTGKKKQLKQQYRCDYLNCIRNIYYIQQNKQDKNNLFRQYIFSTLKIPFHQNKKNLPSQHYQTLFLQIIQKGKNNTDLFNLAIYQEPTILQISKRVKLGQIQYQLLSLIEQVQKAKKQYLKNGTQIDIQNVAPFVKCLLDSQKFMLFVQLLAAIMQNNREVFTTALKNVYQIYMNIANFLKQIYLSFGSDCWLCPQSIFTPLTLKTFRKISEDINADVKSVMYHMVDCLNKDHLPNKVVFQDNKFAIKKVTKLQYLSVIMFYMDDCSKQQEYLSLPELAPINFQTSILLIKSLHMKLKHHEPNAAQMPLFTDYLKQCESYKLKISFAWYKQNLKMNTQQRQLQFSMEEGLKIKSIQQIFRRCLNYRDKQFARKIIQQNHNNKHQITCVELANYLKYNTGINNLPKISGCNQFEAFYLLDQMKTMLSIKMDNLFELSLYDQININYLHLLLTFYNDKIKQAKGSQIYYELLNKIMKEYLQAPTVIAQKFRIKYPKFFSDFIYKYHTLQIFYMLNDILSQNDKFISLTSSSIEKLDEKQSQAYKSSVLYVKNKISVIRQQYFNNLQQIKEDLQYFVVTFSSLLSQNIPFQIFIQATQFVAKILIKVPQLKNSIQLQLFFTQKRLNNKKFIQQLLSYFSKATYISQQQRKVLISKYLISNIQKFMKNLQLHSFLKLIKVYMKINEIDKQSWANGIWETLNNQFKNNKIKPNNFIIYLLLSVKQNLDRKDIMHSMFNQGQQIEQSKNNYLQILQFIKNQKEQFWVESRLQMKNIKIEDYRFIVDLIKEIKDDLTQTNKQVYLKEIWLNYVSKLQNVDIIFYYAAKLQSPELILNHPKIKQILTQFMLYSNFTNQLFPTFKIVLNQYKEFNLILQSVIKQYELGDTIVQNQNFYNKLILINQKYPNPLIQKIIIKWISSSQKKDPVKIHQQYFLNQLKSSLKQIPLDLAQTVILNIHQNPEILMTLIEKNDKIFQKLLYFPIKTYQQFDMSKKEQVQQQEGWQTDSQNEQTKQVTQKQKIAEQGQKQKSQESAKEQMQNQSINGSNDEEDSQQNGYHDRPDILQIFYQQGYGSEFKQYKRFMILREQIDVYIKSNYNILSKMPIKDNEYLCNKILQIQKILESFKQAYQKSIIDQMPKQLHQLLREMGYKLQRNEQEITKKRKQNQKKINFQQERFSDREQESDNESSEYDQDDNYDDYNNEGEQQDQDDDEADSQQSKSQNHDDSNDQDVDMQVPQLQSQLSKIESQIQGNQLQRSELIQIMDVYLIQLLILPNSIFRQKHIVSAFSELVESKFGSMFFQSVLTILRLQQNQSLNKKVYLQKLKKQQKYNKNYQLEEIIGIGQLDKGNGYQNLVSILKYLSQKNKIQEVDPLNKQSSVLLPISQKFFSIFNLSIQSNMITFVLLYLQSKSKLQQFISSNLTIGFPVSEKLQKKYIKKICKLIATEVSPHKVWQYFQNGLNYQIKFKDKALSCLDIYSDQLGKRMNIISQRIDQIFKMQMHGHNIISQQQEKQVTNLHLNQRLYYLIYNLISSSYKHIKQFYFAHKDLMKAQFQADDQNDQKSAPKSVKKISNQIMTNKNLILLLQNVFRIIKTLQKHFFGKIQEKKFNKLIKPLKLIVQTATMYISICEKQQNWKFESPQKVHACVQNYKPGQYKFKRLVEVYNIILTLLNISSFCTKKFKSILMPYLIKNKQLALTVPLIFKVPSIEQQDIQAQYIYLTRQCSFDMAFYQVKSRAILVQFHEEEGSDHGGMIRQLMMGWKGYGVGEQNFFFGKLLGISFNQSVPYGGFVDLAMCIKITSFKVSLQNLKQLDQQIYKSLKYINENNPSDLQLTFQIEKLSQKTFCLETYYLKQNGNQIKLNEQNKGEYIELYMQKYYEIGRQEQLNQIAIGFYTVVNPQYAKIFKPNELLQHLRGKQILDINLLKKHVVYQQGYTQGAIIIKWFWQILQSFNQQTMNKFIQFLTGSPKIPIFNLGFQVTIERVFDVQNLPVAHTCFNTLDLPQYGTKQILQKKLMQAIMEGNQNFGIL